MSSSTMLPRSAIRKRIKKLQAELLYFESQARMEHRWYLQSKAKCQSIIKELKMLVDQENKP